MNNDFKPELTAVQIQINRGSQGLNIFVRTTPKMEEFFKGASGGNTEVADLRVNGRYWVMRDGGYTMHLYSMSPERTLNGIIPSREGNIYGYMLDAPGRKLIEPENNGRGNIINVSFLRCVGLSEHGIEFIVKGVYSEGQVRQIHDGILSAVNAFYEAFLRPINLTINLQEG